MAEPSSGIRLLLVDDDSELVEMMQAYLGRNGFEVASSSTGSDALEKASAEVFSLVVLDVMLPGIDGFAVLRELRRRHSVPVIMLTARVAEADRIAGLEAGADDYLTKPFGPGELLARVRAVLRRTGVLAGATTEVLTAGPFKVHPAERGLWRDGTSIPLTPTEFAIFEHLARASGRLVTRKELIVVLHQCDFPPYDRSLDVHISHLRKKLGADGAFIQTVRGEGYRFSSVRA